MAVKVSIEFTKEEFDKIIEHMDNGKYETVQQAIMVAVKNAEQLKTPQEMSEKTDKKPITEEMHLEKKWFEEAKNIKSIEELSKFVDKMLNSYQHDYGTMCHAIAACSVACAWLGAEVEGITSFQAGFVMWDFIRNWMYESNACGLRLIDYDDFLFPQYGYKFDKVISEETWSSIQKKAKKISE